MANAAPKETHITPEFRASFAHVFKPQPPLQPGGKSKYGLTALFAPGADLSGLKALAAKVAQDFFGDKLKDPNFTKRLRNPFRDQGEKSYEGYVPGAICINMTSENRPGVVDHNVQAIIEESQFYSGCYAKASVSCFGYDKAGNVGVAFGLNNVQKLRDGDPLGGRTRPEDDFKPAAQPAGAAGASATSLFA